LQGDSIARVANVRNESFIGCVLKEAAKPLPTEVRMRVWPKPDARSPQVFVLAQEHNAATCPARGFRRKQISMSLNCLPTTALRARGNPSRLRRGVRGIAF
jgi:hypothetical protein